MHKPSKPLCVNCEHFRQAKAGERFDRCHSPEHGIDLVYGKPIRPTCELQRSAPSGKKSCGQNGVFFTAKTSATEATSEVRP